MDTSPTWPTPWPVKTYTVEDARNLVDLFDLADEVYPRPDSMFPQLTLADMDADYVERGRVTAAKFNLSWPPYLPEVEEYFNDHGTAIKAAIA